MLMTVKSLTVLAVVASGLAAAAAPAQAQAPLGDQALTRLQGKWLSDRGRTINFKIEKNDGYFDDDVGTGATARGKYARDTVADYVLRYINGGECHYIVSFISSDELRREINLRPVRSAEFHEPKDFRCIEGTLKLIPQ